MGLGGGRMGPGRPCRNRGEHSPGQRAAPSADPSSWGPGLLGALSALPGTSMSADLGRGAPGGADNGLTEPLRGGHPKAALLARPRPLPECPAVFPCTPGHTPPSLPGAAQDPSAQHWGPCGFTSSSLRAALASPPRARAQHRLVLQGLWGGGAAGVPPAVGLASLLMATAPPGPEPLVQGLWPLSHMTRDNRVDSICPPPLAGMP